MASQKTRIDLVLATLLATVCAAKRLNFQAKGQRPSVVRKYPADGPGGCSSDSDVELCVGDRAVHVEEVV
jgi:hypothetical protein